MSPSCQSTTSAMSWLRSLAVFSGPLQRMLIAWCCLASRARTTTGTGCNNGLGGTHQQIRPPAAGLRPGPSNKTCFKLPRPRSDHVSHKVRGLFV